MERTAAVPPLRERDSGIVLLTCACGRRSYNRRHDRAADFSSVLDFLRFGASPAPHANFPYRGHAGGMVAAGHGNRVAQAVVHSGRICCALRAGLVFTFLCRTQSSRYVWTPVVVVAGGSENGGDGACGKDGGRGAALRRDRTHWIHGL